ncbi:carboxylesterase 5A-like isoform X1 [Leptopilina boulardi]|uniref:carboxylesterase 5A-like isoform X1 n=2 Tax=Leptopilina boulardi TaxID=63433 RepID=UPI0021F5B340|nr:carboxylesterase 5A-like isoform X1 [Leptopilina boulardi]
MKYTAWMVVALLQEIIFLGLIPHNESQRTHARQGIVREPPTVRIPGQGVLVGKEVLSRTTRVIVYLGVPYAQPPTGPLRFSAPVTDPLPSWHGIRNASQFAPSCQQITSRRKLYEKLYMRLLPQDLPDPGLSEDCLYLNIFIPDGTRPPDGWPVIVWFHSGDFNTGTPAIWDASVFVTKQKVIVVTVAYRLNIFGFFTTMDGEAPGNYGMRDQIAALDWVKNKIELFDGSSSNIVIIGHSAGGISVGLHILSPLSRGKFTKAIILSGDAIGSVRTPDQEASIVDFITEKFGCNRYPTTDLMICLRRASEKELLKHLSDIETWGPILDRDTNNSSDPFLPMDPKDLLNSGGFTAVPLITGFTNNEQALSYIESIGSENVDGRLSLNKFEEMIRYDTESEIGLPDENDTCQSKPEIVSEAVLFYYKPHPPTKDQTILRDRFLDLQTEKKYAAGLTFLAGKIAKQEEAYVYRFDYRPKTEVVSRDVPKWAGVPHMFELPFVWGLPYSINTNIQWNPADKKMSESMMAMLANFARSGNPSLPTVKWDPYTERNPGLLIIKDIKSEMSDWKVIDYKALAFWNDYYPTVVYEATHICCNMTSGSSSQKFSIFSGFTLFIVLQYF